MRIPLYVICWFSLVAFNIFSLPLIFENFITVYLCMFHLEFILPWDSLCFLDLGNCFLSHVRDIFSYYLFKYFLRSFLSLFSFWDPYNVNVVWHCPRGLLNCPHFFSFFFLYSVLWQWFPPLWIPAHWLILLPHLFSYSFILVCFSFQLLYSSTLFGCYLYFLSLY